MLERPQQIEQALFGYDDGHRLLDSSTRLLSAERERLLLLSDLGPGLSGLKSDGYWTGAPLASTERYALMRTWPAPEMPRPGCVWTHVLLIPFEYVRYVWTLKRLTRWVVRPEGEDFGVNYRRALSLEEIEHSGFTRYEKEGNELGSVRCLYYKDCGHEFLNSQDALGAIAVGIWSQQWPELRCRFSFRTIGNHSPGKASLLTFDMGATEGQLQFQTECWPAAWYLEEQRAKKASEALLEDLLATRETGLRIFVRQYGEDFPKHGVWVAFLASIKGRLDDMRRDPHEYCALLDDLSRALPLREDGLRLKSELLTLSPESPFRLSPDWFLEVLEYLSEAPRAKSFPDLMMPEPLVTHAWQTRRAKLIAVLRKLDGKKNPQLLVRLIDVLSRSVEPDDLMESLTDLPEVRRALVKNNPDILQWKGVLSVPSGELSTWIDDLSDDQVRELALIPRLLASESLDIAELLCFRFPADVLRAVCIGRGRLGPSLQVHDRILQFAGEIAPRYLNADFLNSLDSTSALYSFGSMLGFVNSNTVASGPVVWVSTLRKATKDSPEAQTQVLSSFLLALALGQPEEGSEFIFEDTFDLLHRAMKNSVLEYQASVILEGQLPDVSWWRRWDSCQRLRLAVVLAFVRGNLNPESFLKLTHDVGVMGQLFEQLESLDDARAYLDRVRKKLSSAKTPRN